MIRLVQRFIAIAAGLCSGCAAGPSSTEALSPAAPPGRVTIVVPGVFGDGPWYDGLRAAARDAGSTVVTFPWGLPKPLFLGNFSSAGVHDAAEMKLAKAIDDSGERPIDLVGHSAGCGVVLGAIAKCHRAVGRVVLVAPSVSPGYDLAAALAHAERIDVFYSDRDTLFLKWRCGTFGTYDGVKTPAAGFGGFATTAENLTQHAYRPAWATLGNTGGHNGGTGVKFAKAVITPLLLRPDER